MENRSTTKKRSNKFKIGFLIFLALDVIAITTALCWLWMNMASYESSMPIHSAEQAAALFENREFAQIREKSGFTSTRFTTEQDLEEYLKNKLQDVGEIQCIKQRGNTEQITYLLKADQQTIAHAVVKKQPENDRFGRSKWELERLEDVWEPMDGYTILAPQHVQVSLNGVTLTEQDQTEAGTPVKGYQGLPEGYEAPAMVQYQIEGLLQQPEVTASTPEGENCMVSATDENNAVQITVQPDQQKIDELTQLAMNTAKTCAKFTSEDASFYDLSLSLIPQSEFYNAMRSFYNGWYVSHDSYQFEKESIGDWRQYDPQHISCQLSFQYVVNKGSSRHEFPTAYEVFMVNTENGWKVAHMSPQ